MKLYRTARGVLLEEGNRVYALAGMDWDSLVCTEDLNSYLRKSIDASKPDENISLQNVLAPIGQQEVWAAGVTYLRSRTARMEESQVASGGDFYARVYDADRPELFFKTTPHRVVGPNGQVAIRSDARWSVPEPELALLLSPAGKIQGYTIGNDMSSRDIEGENPLYLPQAKVYNRCCALGPAILIADEPLPRTTEILMKIVRSGQAVFSGSTTLESMKRSFETLISYLFLDNSFPHGCFLLTGTGIVPPDSFTLQLQDEIHISIENIGELITTVA